MMLLGPIQVIVSAIVACVFVCRRVRRTGLSPWWGIAGCGLVALLCATTVILWAPPPAAPCTGTMLRGLGLPVSSIWNQILVPVVIGIAFAINNRRPHMSRCAGLLSLAFVLLLASHARAQLAPDGVVADAMKAAGNGKTLQAISLLESHKDHTYNDILGALYSFVGNSEKAETLRPHAARDYETALPTDCRLTEALSEIARLAAGRQLVIINEAHDAPEHRAFVGSLVEKLKSIGFSYYAFETLAEGQQSLKSRGYPVQETGFYSQEPRFGELIRDAIRCGLIPIRYEAEDNATSGNPLVDINTREQAQCDNLVEQVFRETPDARIIIHVGPNHVMEKPRDVGNDKIIWLAARLKTTTGIDPLTIDQITRLRSFPPEQQLPTVAYSVSGEPFVGGPYEGYVDLQVYHPPTRMKKNRPDWLLSDQRRRVVNIPDEIKVESKRILLQASYVNESSDAIPADQVLLHPNEPRPVLSLRPGAYRLVRQNEEGDILPSLKLDVP